MRPLVQLRRWTIAVLAWLVLALAAWPSRQGGSPPRPPSAALSTDERAPTAEVDRTAPLEDGADLPAEDDSDDSDDTVDPAVAAAPAEGAGPPASERVAHARHLHAPPPPVHLEAPEPPPRS